MPEKITLEQRMRELKEAYESLPQTEETRARIRELESELERMQESQQRRAKSTEPTCFFDAKQVKKDVYEYVESKDVYVEEGHKIDLGLEIDLENTNQILPQKDKQVVGAAVMFKQGDGYYQDGGGGALISQLKKYAAEKARGIAKSRGYDAFLFEDSNVKWDVVGFEPKSSFFSTYINPYIITYGLTAVVEFYRRKDSVPW